MYKSGVPAAVVPIARIARGSCEKPKTRQSSVSRPKHVQRTHRFVDTHNRQLAVQHGGQQNTSQHLAEIRRAEMFSSHNAEQAVSGERQLVERAYCSAQQSAWCANKTHTQRTAEVIQRGRVQGALE